MTIIIVIKVYVLITEAHTELANLRHLYRIFGIGANALLFQCAVGRCNIALWIYIVILSICIGVLGTEVERTAKQRIGHCQFRCQHTVSHPIFCIKCTVILNLAVFYYEAFFIVAAMKIVEVPINIQFPHLTYIIGIQFMLRIPLCLFLGQVFPFVIKLSVCCYIAQQSCCFVLIGRECVFVFGTKRMVLI